ncbi:energy-coupling factor transporter transmembrane component T family protein [Kocuria rhizophila]|uniref:Putative ABC transporter permease protein n=1 Tax=Kocuria rhizophila (strain ATCC 9341 / DSM 348 / NBRC 103217 / DC2201) TaxID=378753 RepID=B2GHA6_KOCRD|nr:energy-coupling factor transporter transmembrane protein EcfT [Kocuria rhizophila]BAG29579.1 putative ABC transporter permease protein [Kocuria rhizophila DC2201]VEH75142.1 Energy-coupling factor transporter transmembrane protein BioN [Kocuria rhizophila]
MNRGSGPGEARAHDRGGVVRGPGTRASSARRQRTPARLRRGGRRRARGEDLLGSYVPGTSALHRCPLWAKAALLLGASLAVMLLRAWPVSLAVLALTAVVSASSGLGLRRWAASLRPLWFLVLLLTGYHVLATGPARAADVVLSMLAVIALSRLLISSTALPRLIDGLVLLCSPLRRVGVDPERVGLAVSLMIRSVPWLFGVMSTLRDAAAARTVRPHAARLVTPAVIAAVDYAHRSGEALAARGLD